MATAGFCRAKVSASTLLRFAVLLCLLVAIIITPSVSANSCSFLNTKKGGGIAKCPDSCQSVYITKIEWNNTKQICNNEAYFNDTNTRRVYFKEISTTRSEHEVKFIWKPDHTEAYRFTVNVSESESARCTEFKDSGGLVSRLEAGTSYKFLISLVPLNDAGSDNILAVFTTTQWTKPAKPGNITWKEVPDVKHHYDITAIASRGNVSHYKITVGTESHTVQKPTSGFKLTPGKQYSVIVQAYNGNGENTENHRNITINASTAGQVENLKIIHGSSHAVVNWTQPSDPNGNIIGYKLLVDSKDIGRNVQNCILASLDCQSLNKSRDVVMCGNYSLKCIDNANSIISVKVTGLEPYSNYSVSVQAINEAGLGEVRNSSFMTRGEAANNVTDLILMSKLNPATWRVELTVRWKPGYYTGPTWFSIVLEEETALGSNDFNKTISKNISETEYTDGDALAGWNYMASVQAHTTQGSSSVIFSGVNMTEENRPGLIQNLTVAQNEIVAKEVTIQFNQPPETKRNGTIIRYTIEKVVLGTDGREDEEKAYQIISLGKCGDYCNDTIREIIVGRNYTFAVRAENEKHNGSFSNKTELQVKPKKPRLNETLKVYNATHLIWKSMNLKIKEESIDVRICTDCVKDASQGVVTHAGLVVCINGSQRCDEFRNRDTTVEDFTKLVKWTEANKELFTVPYRATPDTWKDNPASSDGTFTIGEKSCVEDENKYCNGPLIPGKKFIVFLVVCNEAKCDKVASPEVFLTKDVPERNRTLIIVVIILSFILIIVIIIIILWRRGTLRRAVGLFKVKEASKCVPIPENRPFKIRDFEEHVRKLHKDSNLMFQDEFEDLRKVCMTMKTSFFEAQREENRIKNRYTDILPYDHSRVKLNVQPEGDETMDFINANYIPGLNSVREYIATQGPMSCNLPDFWRMVWEQKSTVIVMLSDLQENAKRKVDLYWPEDLNDPICYDNVVVNLTNFSQVDKYIVRSLQVSKGGETRTVTHLFLPGWWDHSANLTNDDVLGFVKLVRQQIHQDTAGPVIVHCSAGVGRTGTMIALDYFTQYIDQHSLDDDIDIFEYVLRMRRNRPRMVQTENQYIFIFDALLDIVQRKMDPEYKKPSETNPDNENPEETGKPETDKTTEKTSPHVSIHIEEDGKCVYENQAFEPDNLNTESSNADDGVKEDNPTTEL